MKFLLLFLLSTSAFAQFTALPPLPPVENAILTKGGLLTSNGTAQVEALACADDEIIVYDSAETNGFKCAAAPSGGSASIYTQNITGGPFPTGETVVATFNVTAVGGEAVSISPTAFGFTGTYHNEFQGVAGAGCRIRVFRDSVLIGQAHINNASVSVPLPSFIDYIAVGGSPVYTIRTTRLYGSNCGMGGSTNSNQYSVILH